MSGAGTEETPPHTRPLTTPVPHRHHVPGEQRASRRTHLLSPSAHCFWGWGGGRPLAVAFLSQRHGFCEALSDSQSISSSRTECGDRPESDWVRLRKRSGPGSDLETSPGLDPTRKPARASVGPSLTWKTNLTWVRLGPT